MGIRDQLSATNLINHMGSTLEITSYYRVVSDYTSPSQELFLNSTYGLAPGVTLYIGTETVDVIDRTDSKVRLKYPLATPLKAGDIISASLTTKGKSVKRSKSGSKELNEYYDSLRVSIDTPVSFGSLVKFENRNFFVVGLDPSESSLLLYLRETNVTLTIINPNSGTYNGFGYTKQDVVVKDNLPGCLHFMNGNLDETELGDLPTTRRTLIFPAAYQIDKTHIYIINDKRYKIVEVAELRLKNLNVVILDYDLKK